MRREGGDRVRRIRTSVCVVPERDVHGSAIESCCTPDASVRRRVQRSVQGAQASVFEIGHAGSATQSIVKVYYEAKVFWERTLI
jgi:hypothetical protein